MQERNTQKAFAGQSVRPTDVTRDRLIFGKNGKAICGRGAFGDIARAKGMTQIAKKTGLGLESLYKALSAQGNPEFSTIVKVINALGLHLHVRSSGKTKKAA